MFEVEAFVGDSEMAKKLLQVLTLRSYFRELDIMKEQLLTISFDATRSACCDQNHLDAQGAPLLCDRRVVKECVKIWFGSQEAFEDAVRSEVLDMLMVVLNEKVFTYTWTLSVTMPFFWTFLDLSVTFAPFSSPTFWEHSSVKLLIEGLVLWLLAFPSVKDLLIMFCRLTRAKGRTLCIEIFKNLMVALSCGGFSEHSLGTLSCSSIRRRNTNSCLVGGRCVVFDCLASWQCWRESDLETLWKWNVALALKGWVCPDFHWRNRWPNSKWVGRIVGRCFFSLPRVVFFLNPLQNCFLKEACCWMGAFLKSMILIVLMVLDIWKQFSKQFIREYTTIFFLEKGDKLIDVSKGGVLAMFLLNHRQ